MPHRKYLAHRIARAAHLAMAEQRVVDVTDELGRNIVARVIPITLPEGRRSFRVERMYVPIRTRKK